MRLLEIISDGPLTKDLREWVDGYECMKWFENGKNGIVVTKMILQEDEVVSALKNVQELRGHSRAFIYNIEGVVGIEDEEEDEDDLGLARFFTSSKEELRKLIIAPVNLSWNFLIMVIASSMVAGIGILQDNVAIVIGAMVIAPFLGPNMLIAFGTVLGDLNLIRKGMLVAAVGTILAILISVVWGTISADAQEIPRGYTVTMQDVVLAFACGIAGALSQLSRQGTTLVGVMVAAALLPPLISAGLFLGGGYYEDASHKLVLFATNIVCLISSGIIVFYLAGISPNNWWEKEMARSRTATSLIILAIILLMLMAVIYNLNL